MKGILTVKFNMKLASFPYDEQNITLNFDLFHFSKNIAVLYPKNLDDETSAIRIS